MTLQLRVRVSSPAPSVVPSWPHRPPQPGARLTVGLRPQDTPEENAVPSHSATATLVLEVQPVDRRPPWFLPCLYSDLLICVQAQYHGAIPTGHKLVLGGGCGGVPWGQIES